MNRTPLTERDRKALWHPYTQHGWGDPLAPVERASGAYLYLEDGRKILDAISSWWVNLHGHSHPYLAKAIADQAHTLEHVMFAGFTHRPAVELAERLLALPALKAAELSKAFYSDNGSTAVEVALKMAFQFHQRGEETGRTRFLALRGAYHGDTLGAMAVSDSGFETIFRPLLTQVDTFSIDDLDELDQLLAVDPCPYAAFIFEPGLQGANGMVTFPPERLAQAVERCRARGILCIADEIFTGFYRTGTFFAFERSRIRPDMVCLSKGLTGGFLPLSVTLTHEALFERFLDDELSQAFLHGHSYTANPLACAVGLASLDLLERPDVVERITSISARTAQHCQRLEGAPGVVRSWSLGTMGAIEVENHESGYFVSRSREIRRQALERGVLLRPLGTVLYSLPPYCVTDPELDRIFTVMAELAANPSDQPA